MTRARYSSSDNTLKEISQMEVPICINGISSNLCSSILGKDCSCEIYKKHIASLRAIPCHDSCRGLWKDNDVLEECKDYEVKEALPEAFWDDDIVYKYIAFPLVPVKSEDDPYEELWRDVYAETEAAIDWQYQEINDKKLIATLKSKYTITRKQ